MLSAITPLILTCNEAPNIRRTLDKVQSAKDILIVDSFSTDETLRVAKSFPQVRVLQRKFDSFAGQCNFGLRQICSEWVLSMDADYVLSDGLLLEIKEKINGADQRTGANGPKEEVAGFEARFVYCVQGKPLRASLYPPRTVLYRKALARYRDEGHSHRVQVQGKVVPLKAPIYHDDRKPFERWFHEQVRYSAIEAKHLVETPRKQLNRADRIRRKILLAPGLVFLNSLLGKRLIFDGWAGWHYVFQRTLAEFLVSLRLIEWKLGRAETLKH
jgi:glycosyltransferase involved in cell wall biosynthesis